MESGMVAAVTAVKDGWGLAALMVVGVFAVTWKHAKILMREIFTERKSDSPHAERRRATDRLIHELIDRIESLEQDGREKSVLLGKMVDDVHEAKLHFARCDTELRLLRNENRILQQRVSMFEQAMRHPANGITHFPDEG